MQFHLRVACHKRRFGKRLDNRPTSVRQATHKWSTCESIVQALACHLPSAPTLLVIWTIMLIFGFSGYFMLILQQTLLFTASSFHVTATGCKKKLIVHSMDCESIGTVKESGYSSATSSGLPVVSTSGRFSDSYSPNTVSSIACLSLISPDRLMPEEFGTVVQAVASTSKLSQSLQLSPFHKNHSYAKTSIIVALDLGGNLVYNKMRRRRFPSDPMKHAPRHSSNIREEIHSDILIETCDRGNIGGCFESAPVVLPDVPINSPGRPMTTVNPFPVARPRRSRPREAEALYNERVAEARRTLGRRLRLIADEFDAPYNLRRRRLLNNFGQDDAFYRFLQTIVAFVGRLFGAAIFYH